jgi:hypothetical protein
MTDWIRMGGQRTCVVALALVWCCIWVGPLGAAVGRGVPLDERVRGAERVIVGTALSIAARWHDTPSGDRIIVSRLLVRVDETWKGSTSETVWVDVDGGTLNGVTLRVSGIETVEEGERAVWLLDRAGDSVYAPHLRGMGILPIDERDRIRGTRVALSDVRAAARRAAGGAR